jgi:hypothetical protein
MSRQPGWSAVANPQKAEDAFNAWCTRSNTLSINELILARDYAVLRGKMKRVIEELNSDLRDAVCASIRRGEQK